MSSPPTLLGSGEPVSLQGIRLTDATTGTVVDLGELAGLSLLILMRHRHCLPCQEHLVRLRDAAGSQLAGLETRVVAVGFSPGEPLAALAAHLEWPFPFLSDPDRVLYARLGLRRASRRAVFNRGTLRIYREAVTRGQAVHLPVEDALQLGGDAVVSDGVAVQVFRPTSPDDRPAMETLLGALRSVQERVTGSP